MFLDDELEAIFKEGGFTEVPSVKLMSACMKRFPNPEMPPEDFLKEIRKIDAGWNLFCKRHPEYDPSGFRKVCIKLGGDAFTGDILKLLKWN